jgi:hypothetical protein
VFFAERHNQGEIMSVEVTQVVWTGPVTWRHLALLFENEKFRETVSSKLAHLGCTNPEYREISAVTQNIEDLVVALEVSLTRQGKRFHNTIHVKMDGFEVTFH